MFRGALGVEAIFFYLFISRHGSREEFSGKVCMASWSKFTEVQLSNKRGEEEVLASVGETWLDRKVCMYLLRDLYWEGSRVMKICVVSGPFTLRA